MSRDLTLVITDDQDVVRAGLAALLDGVASIRVVGTGSDGYQAVELVRRHHPDIVLMDIRMPGLNGIDAIDAIRRDPTCASTRAVVLTTYGLDEYVFGALRAGADAFLLKDTEPDDLVKAIHRVANGDQVISPAATRTLVEDFLNRPAKRERRIAPTLTQRESDVLAGICRGLPNREIAAELWLGDATVKTYVSRLLDKFGAESRTGLVIAAYECGLVTT